MARSVAALIDEIDLLASRGLPRKEFFAELAPRVRTVRRQRRELLAHARPAHASADQRRPRGADRPRDPHPGAGPRRRRADHPQRVHDRRRQHVRRARRQAGAGRDPRPRHPWQSREQPALPRSPPAAPTSRTSSVPHSSSAGASGARSTSPAARRAARSSSRTPTPSPRSPAAVARGIRTSLRFDAARRINGLEAPGLVVLGPGDEVEMITPPARELLASIAASDIPYTDDDMPAAVLSLAGFVRSAPHAAQGGANVVTVPADDSWVTLHASRPGSASDGRVAIVIERASAARSATVRLEAFGATAREREVATLLARGLSRVRDRRVAGPLSAHGRGPHQEPLQQGRRRFAPGARRPGVPRRVPPRGSPEHAADLPRTLRPRLASESTYSGCAGTADFATSVPHRATWPSSTPSKGRIGSAGS